MENKIILLNEPGKIITPFAKEANVRPFAAKVKSTPRDITKVAKDTYDKMNDEEKAKLQKAFEEKYGTDRMTRTKEQWQALVNVYGLHAVSKTEKLTPKQVALKCGWKKSKSSQLSKKK